MKTFVALNLRTTRAAADDEMRTIFYGFSFAYFLNPNSLA